MNDCVDFFFFFFWGGGGGGGGLTELLDSSDYATYAWRQVTSCVAKKAGEWLPAKHLHQFKVFRWPIDVKMNVIELTKLTDPLLHCNMVHRSRVAFAAFKHQWPLLLTWFNFNPSMDK